MFEDIESRKEKLAKAYHAAVAEQEEAEKVKRDQLTALLLIEDSGENTEKSRRALAVAKDNIELAERRVEKKLADLQVLIAREVDNEIKSLDRKFSELETTALDQLRAAGVCVGQAQAFFSSLGGQYGGDRELRNIAAAFKTMEGPEPAAFLRGYSEGKNKQIENINQLKSHYNHLRQVKTYKSNRENYEYKLLHRALRKYAK